MLCRGMCGLYYFRQENCSWMSFMRGPQVIGESSSSRKGDVASPKKISSHSRYSSFFLTPGSYVQPLQPRLILFPELKTL
jgi:hypothetical protein